MISLIRRRRVLTQLKLRYESKLRASILLARINRQEADRKFYEMEAIWAEIRRMEGPGQQSFQ